MDNMEMVTIIISSVSLIVALWSIKVSRDNTRRQIEYEKQAEQRSIERERQAEQRRKQEIRQDAHDRLEAKRIANESPFARLAGVADEVEEKTYLEIRAKRR